MSLVKVQYLGNDGKPRGKAYTFKADMPVSKGDTVRLDVAGSTGVVVETEVDEKEVAAFKDRLKPILGKVAADEEKDG